LKGRLRASDARALQECPFCRARVAARNLLRHCDQHHASDYL